MTEKREQLPRTIEITKRLNINQITSVEQEKRKSKKYSSNNYERLSWSCSTTGSIFIKCLTSFFLFIQPITWFWNWHQWKTLINSDRQRTSDIFIQLQIKFFSYKTSPSFHLLYPFHQALSLFVLLLVVQTFLIANGQPCYFSSFHSLLL